VSGGSTTPDNEDFISTTVRSDVDLYTSFIAADPISMSTIFNLVLASIFVIALTYAARRFRDSLAGFSKKFMNLPFN